MNAKRFVPRETLDRKAGSREGATLERVRKTKENDRVTS